MAYTPTTQYNIEWDERMARLMKRGLNPRAANIVLNAAMYGIGCTEGVMREKIEREKINKNDLYTSI